VDIINLINKRAADSRQRTDVDRVVRMNGDVISPQPLIEDTVPPGMVSTLSADAVEFHPSRCGYSSCFISTSSSYSSSECSGISSISSSGCSELANGPFSSSGYSTACTFSYNDRFTVCLFSSCDGATGDSSCPLSDCCSEASFKGCGSSSSLSLLHESPSLVGPNVPLFLRLPRCRLLPEDRWLSRTSGSGSRYPSRERKTPCKNIGKKNGFVSFHGETSFPQLPHLGGWCNEG
jgi:hypothetical protein